MHVDRPGALELPASTAARHPGAPVPMPARATPSLRPNQLDLLRRTVAQDCSREEFDLFIEVANRYGLDPFRRQIMPLVFSKDRPEKRRMVIIVGIDGQRMIAQRCGNYRPASEPTKFIENRRKKGPTNPLGLVLARVTLHQQDNRGEWFPVVGEAYWDELAPIRDEWEEDEQTGRSARTGRQVLDTTGNWVKMPRLMLAKCATMQALRAGWPDQFGGLHVEEEMDREKVIDLMASEAADRVREESRLIAIAGKDAITVSFGDWALENVPLGQFADRVLAWIKTPGRTPSEVRHWAEANRDPLRAFWAKSSSDALELKKVIEAKSKEPSGSAGLEGPADSERSSEEAPEDASPEKAPVEDSGAVLATGRTGVAHGSHGAGPTSPLSPREA
jgi:phage recombination protein Bet